MPIDISKITGNLTRGSSTKADASRIQESNATNEKSHGFSSFHAGSFSKGQVFNGQITNISPNEITIELENGDTMTAGYDNLSDLSIGDGARFKVVSNSNNTLMIKALTSPNGALDSAILKALDSSGLPFSEKNEELITALLKNEFPVNKQMINKILLQSLKNTDISISNLVLMNKAGLPITPEMTAYFEAYDKGFDSFQSNIQENTEYLLEMIDGLINDNQPQKAIELTHELLGILDIHIESDSYVESNVSPNERQPHSLPQNLEELNELLKEVFVAENEVKNQEENPEVHIKDRLLSETKLSELFSEAEILDIFSAFETSDVEASSIQKLIEGELSLEDFTKLIDQLSEDEKKNQSLLPETLKEFSIKISSNNETKVFGELLPRDANLSETAERLLTMLASKSLDIDTKISLLKHPKIGETIEKLLIADFTLTPEELGKEDFLTTFYNRSNQLLSKLLDFGEKNSENLKDFSKQIASAKDQLQFLNTLSQYHSYAELPMRLTGQKTTGDLYVYSNKKKGKVSENDSISCLLHLDLENLGAMNVRIELNQNSVSTKFYLEDEESGKLISKNLDELDKAILKQGFHPESEVVKTSKKEKDEPFSSGKYNLVRDFIPSELSKKNFTRYTFDVRA